MTQHSFWDALSPALGPSFTRTVGTMLSGQGCGDVKMNQDGAGACGTAGARPLGRNVGLISREDCVLTLTAGLCKYSSLCSLFILDEKASAEPTWE